MARLSLTIYSLWCRRRPRERRQEKQKTCKKLNCVGLRVSLLLLLPSGRKLNIKNTCYIYTSSSLCVILAGFEVAILEKLHLKNAPACVCECMRVLSPQKLLHLLITSDFWHVPRQSIHPTKASRYWPSAQPPPIGLITLTLKQTHTQRDQNKWFYYFLSVFVTWSLWKVYLWRNFT